MKYIFGFVTLFLSATALQAATFNCEGRVVRVMADHGCPDPGRLAYKTSGTGGGTGAWLCSESQAADSILLLAITTNQEVLVNVRVTEENTDCNAITHYTVHQQLQLRSKE